MLSRALSPRDYNGLARIVLCEDIWDRRRIQRAYSAALYCIVDDYLRAH